jgi:HPt (histidine-containing phosphotransfer) domain-containing protein
LRYNHHKLAEKTEMKKSELIDERVAGQLLSHKRNGQSAFERLVPVFADEAKMLVEQMRCALAASDLEGLRLTAHKLKGGASVLGSLEIRDRAQALMDLLDEGGHPGPGQLLEIEQAIERFVREAAKIAGK